MDRPEVIPLTPDDDKFHPYGDHPYETETFWASFHHPERRLGGWFYNQVLFNQDINNGGVWVWDGSPAASLHQVNQHGLPLVDKDAMDLRDVLLPNGNHIEMLEPLQKYRVRRSDPGAFEADLTFEGVIPAHSHPIGVAPFWRGRHFDQPMHVTGQIELHGEVIDIDSLLRTRPLLGPASRTSRSRNQRRQQARVRPAARSSRRRPPYSPFGIGYVFATQDADESFLAYTLPCIYDGEARDFVTTGYLVRDGQLRPAPRRQPPLRVRPGDGMDAQDLARGRRRARTGADRRRRARQPPRRERPGHRLLPLGLGRRQRLRRGPVHRSGPTARGPPDGEVVDMIDVTSFPGDPPAPRRWMATSTRGRPSTAATTATSSSAARSSPR